MRREHPRGCIRHHQRPPVQASAGTQARARCSTQGATGSASPAGAGQRQHRSSGRTDAVSGRQRTHSGHRNRASWIHKKRDQPLGHGSGRSRHFRRTGWQAEGEGATGNTGERHAHSPGSGPRSTRAQNSAQRSHSLHLMSAGSAGQSAWETLTLGTSTEHHVRIPGSGLRRPDQD